MPSPPPKRRVERAVGFELHDQRLAAGVRVVPAVTGDHDPAVRAEGQGVGALNAGERHHHAAVGVAPEARVGCAVGVEAGDGDVVAGVRQLDARRAEDEQFAIGLEDRRAEPAADVDVGNDQRAVAGERRVTSPADSSVRDSSGSIC
jgi:hypothetical protein